MPMAGAEGLGYILGQNLCWKNGDVGLHDLSNEQNLQRINRVFAA